MIQRIPKEELIQYSLNSDLGLSIDKDTNLNYRFSLPNKLFDYIHARIPVLASPLPEIQKIISEYQIGEFITYHFPKDIAKRINEMLWSEKLYQYKKSIAKII